MGISTSLHIVIGEQVPKNWAINHSDRVLPIVAAPLVAFTYLFFPLIWLLNTVTTRVLKLIGVANTKPGSLGGIAAPQENDYCAFCWPNRWRKAPSEKGRAASSPARSKSAS